MTRIIIKELIIQGHNITHIAKHGVTVEEVEEAITHFVYHKRTYNDRYLTVGRSGGRILTVIIKRSAPTTYELVTARDASKKERSLLYGKEQE